MVGFAHVATLAAGPLAMVSGIRDLLIRAGSEGVFLYSATGPDGGLGAWRLAADGIAAPVETRAWTGGAAMPAGCLVPVALDDGSTTLLALGRGGGALQGYDLDAAGGFGATVTGFVPDRAFAGTPLVGTAVGGFVATSWQGVPGLALYRVGGDGSLDFAAAVDPVAQSAVPGGGQVSALAGLGNAGGQFLIVGLSGPDQVLCYHVDAAGALTLTDQTGRSEGLGVAGPAAICAVNAADGAYAVVAGAGSSTLSVLRVNAQGQMIPVDHVIDSFATRMQAVTALATVTDGGWTYVLAGGGDDGITLLALMPGGRLVHLATLADSAGTALANVTAIEAVVQGGRLLVFAASETEPGITELSVDLSDRGAILVSPAGAGTVTGGAADDILIGADGAASLFGGGGADLFQFRPLAVTPEGRIGEILDYRPGLDRIDLSLFPMVYGLGQIEVVPTGTGARLEIGSAWLEVQSWDGRSLRAQDFTDAGLAGLQHGYLGNRGGGAVVLPPDLPPDPPPDPPDDPVDPGGPGTIRPLILTGGGGPNRLAGGGGNDTLSGGAGNDRIFGNAGNDVIRGQNGADTLDGGGGDDFIFGGSGSGDRRDVIQAGAGNDRADGGYGDDQLFGMDGHDRLTGGHGRDDLRGQAGNDTLVGGAAADRLSGGAGHDVLYGGPGSDLLSGGAGADHFHHSGGAGQGTDTVLDYRGGDGDVLVFDGSGRFRDFRLSHADAGLGQPGVAEVVITWKPTGQVLWVLADGAALHDLNVMFAGMPVIADLI